MATSKVSANERRLAKLMEQADCEYGAGLTEPCGDGFWLSVAAFLAKRGVLAVSKATVTLADATRLVSLYPESFRAVLRAHARGAR